MQSTHVSIFPLFVLLGIGLSLLIAVTIVIVSLVKSGKGAGAVVAMVALVLCGLFFAGLFIPVFYARQAATVRFQHEQADMHAHHQELQARQFGGNEDVTVLHLPPAVNITPPPQPAQPPLTAAPQTIDEAFPQAAEALPQAEVTTDLEVETASESSASPEEVPMPTESSQPAEASLEPSPVTRPPRSGARSGRRTSCLVKGSSDSLARRRVPQDARDRSAPHAGRDPRRAAAPSRSGTARLHE